MIFQQIKIYGGQCFARLKRPVDFQQYYLRRQICIMPARKPWTPKQDQTLKRLRQEEGDKWSVIAKKMKQLFGIVGRSGKQCRERYHNHLDAKIISQPWEVEEQQLLLRLHDRIGNKWSRISSELKGRRSDNSVKNHFYSKLRKSLRRLNKLINEKYKRELKEIKVDLLYKIVEKTEERFSIQSSTNLALIEACIHVKNRLFELEVSKAGSWASEQLATCKELIDDIKHIESQIYQKARKRDFKIKKQPQTATSMIQEISLYSMFKHVCDEIVMLSEDGVKHSLI